MHTVCIIQARMGSSRLPGKVMKPMAGKPALWHVLDRVGRCRLINDIVIATTTEPADQQIVDYCKDQSWNVTRGSESDVLERYHQTAIAYAADIVIRITSDCPLIDPEILTRLIREFAAADVDYMSTNYPSRTFPVGCDCEIMTMEALDRAHKEATTPYDREHVTPYLYTNSDLFRVAGIADDRDRSNARLTLDTQQDYDLLAAIYERFYRPGEIVKLSDAVRYQSSVTDIADP